jgi:hypothetical protein
MNIAHVSYDATLLNRHFRLSGDLLITHSQDENYVIPAKAGIHVRRRKMGPRFRGDDGWELSVILEKRGSALQPNTLVPFAWTTVLGQLFL